MKIAKSLLIQLSLIFGIVAILLIALYFYFPKIWGDLFYPLDYEEHIIKYSKEYKIEPALSAAIIYTESHFNPKAVSRVGARGLMQIMPSTGVGIAERIGDEKMGDLFDPETNIRYGIYYIAEKISYYNGDINAALAAYNGGNAVGNRYVVSRSTEGLPRETQGYIKTVNVTKTMYEKLYSDVLNAKNVAEMLKVQQEKREKTWFEKFLEAFSFK